MGGVVWAGVRSCGSVRFQIPTKPYLGVEHDAVHDDPEAEDGEQALVAVVHAALQGVVAKLAPQVGEPDEPEQHAAALEEGRSEEADAAAPHERQPDEGERPQPRAPLLRGPRRPPEAAQALWRMERGV